MHFVIAFLSLVGFPALATRASSRSGARGLAWVTSSVLALLVLVGLALASPVFGNRLAATEGYWPVAARVLLILGLGIAMPVLLAAGTIHVLTLMGRSQGLVFGAGLAVSLASGVLGVVLLFAILWG